MNPIRALKLLVLLVGALAAHAAFADSWLPATTQRYVSADGAWRLTVEPRAITGPLEYFQDQVDGKDNPGGVPGSTHTSARGTMERRVNGAWQRVWQRPLRNDVAPVDVVVLPGGTALTLDNWHSMGYGSDAVVLYDQQGTAVAAYALTDFLPEDYVQALPRSVSSMGWRGEAKALSDGKRVMVPVVVPTADAAPYEKDAAHVPVIFDLAAGKVEPPAGRDWDHAVEVAREARKKQLAAEAEERRRFIEPLQAPAEPDERSWHAYMVEAFFRLDRDWDDTYPATKVLRLPGAPGYRASEKWVHEALWDEFFRDGTTMFASLSQDALVERIEAEVKDMPAGMLSRAHIYLVLDSARFARARSALIGSGAHVIQIDPEIPIPQRPARLKRYLEREAESED